ncbi:hypothetical protein WMY93_034299 [Mugilogobius chulae]|uniref:Uncharacterized protein n=1 Tax=Mugilogobius chulae TaxID=88201 RepID=A0AAW0MJR0_9GOBI
MCLLSLVSLSGLVSCPSGLVSGPSGLMSLVPQVLSQVPQVVSHLRDAVALTLDDLQLWSLSLMCLLSLVSPSGLVSGLMCLLSLVPQVVSHLRDAVALTLDDLQLWLVEGVDVALEGAERGAELVAESGRTLLRSFQGSKVGQVASSGLDDLLTRLEEVTTFYLPLPPTLRKYKPRPLCINPDALPGPQTNPDALPGPQTNPDALPVPQTNPDALPVPQTNPDALPWSSD